MCARKLGVLVADHTSWNTFFSTARPTLYRVRLTVSDLKVP